MMLSLALVLFLGSNWCHGQYRTNLRLPDGEADSTMYANHLYIQEGAIIDIVCSEYDNFLNLGTYYDLIAEYLYGVNLLDTGWTLTSESRTADRAYSVTGWGAAGVDDNKFPDEENWEAYNSFWTYDLPATLIWYGGRHMNTIRYTARMEDNNKFLTCRYKYLGNLNGRLVSMGIRLIIRPGPAPLTFHSSILHKWRGGFVGEIHVPISDFFTSWKMILEFPKKVHDLSGGHFQVANEPCLHDPDCGDDIKNTWVIYNTFSNRVMNPGDELHLVFYALTGKRVDLGLKAKVHFYGYNQVYHTEVEPYSSSSDIHIKFSSSSLSSSSSSAEPQEEAMAEIN